MTSTIAMNAKLLPQRPSFITQHPTLSRAPASTARRATHPGIRAAADTTRDAAPSSSGSNHPSPPLSWQHRLTGAACGAALAAALVFTPPAMAVDNAKVGTCVLSKCQGALAGCLADGPCIENLVCLQLCNDRPDETECQIKCGDKYQDKAVDLFNTCAVSEKKCVPQKVDEGLYPIPPDCSLDTKFDLGSFQGRWYITAGLNPLFDVFPCQEHYFTSPEPGTVYGKINWRIPQTSGDFLERSTMQRFVQDSSNPAILFNHGNEYLHYEDDWYIIGSKPDEYVFIYYRGQNDAWKGYGGATVYTRSSSLPQSLIPELRAQADAAGLKWDDFTLTDNTCPAHPPKKALVEEIEDDVVEAERYAVTAVESAVEPSLRSFGRGFTVLEKDVQSAASAVVRGLEAEEEGLEAELKRETDAAGRAIRRMEMEASMGKWVQYIPLKLRELIMPVQ